MSPVCNTSANISIFTYTVNGLGSFMQQLDNEKSTKEKISSQCPKLSTWFGLVLLQEPVV